MAIEFKQGELQHWVSAWDEAKQQGIKLGYIEAQPNKPLLHQLGEFLEQNEMFQSFINEKPTHAQQLKSERAGATNITVNINLNR